MMQLWRAGALVLALVGVAVSGCQRVSPPAAATGSTAPTSSAAFSSAMSPAAATSADTAISGSSPTSQASVVSSTAATPQQPSTRTVAAVSICPARLKAAAQPLPPVNGISTRLVPATPVRSALLCSYGGTNMDPAGNQRLSGSRTLTSRLAELAQDLRWLPPQIHGQPHACAAGGGVQTNYLLALLLADGTTAWVAAAQDPNSCAQAANGTFTALANIGPELTATMKTGQWPGRKPFSRGDACVAGGRYGQQSRLVPDGAVALDICRSTGGVFQTVTHVTTGLGALVDALNAKATITSTHFCAISTPTLMYNLAFRYASGPAVEVQYIKGCSPAIDNSSLQATDDGRLVSLVEALVPASKRIDPTPTSDTPTSSAAKPTR